MTDINLEDRLREAFGAACPQVFRGPRRLSDVRVDELRAHHAWSTSQGRFGKPLTWKNISVPFSKSDLSAEDFSTITIENCPFEWSDLRCTSFKGAVLKNVSFTKCDLEGADFTDAQLENVSFIECFDLDKAKFSVQFSTAPVVTLNRAVPEIYAVNL